MRAHVYKYIFELNKKFLIILLYYFTLKEKYFLRKRIQKYCNGIKTRASWKAFQVLHTESKIISKALL